MHNQIVDNVRLNGQTVYSADRAVMAGRQTIECTFARNIEKLNLLVPKGYDSLGCRFSIDYEYLESMRRYVSENSHLSSKLSSFSKFEFDNRTIQLVK